MAFVAVGRRCGWSAVDWERGASPSPVSPPLRPSDRHRLSPGRFVDPYDPYDPYEPRRRSPPPEVYRVAPAPPYPPRRLLPGRPPRPELPPLGAPYLAGGPPMFRGRPPPGPYGPAPGYPPAEPPRPGRAPFRGRVAPPHPGYPAGPPRRRPASRDRLSEERRFGASPPPERSWKAERYREVATARRGKGDEFVDPWMRAKSPKGGRRRRSYSSGSSARSFVPTPLFPLRQLVPQSVQLVLVRQPVGQQSQLVSQPIRQQRFALAATRPAQG
ncbi:hypothetical protein FJT64_027787 [Amphibalanus amphitrite]|uniref:Uncharacterized protein n=1 Tax=Amphibalanus amphitrite TaxID=1232801 RepID=A0A6A4W6T6_AMPAM|nr:hypothetical protein FJT64_027787 [Amphibalanus amphitrite]